MLVRTTSTVSETGHRKDTSYAPMNAKPHYPPPGEGWGFAIVGLQKTHSWGKTFWPIPTNPLLPPPPPPLMLFIYIKKMSMQMQEGKENKHVKKQELIHYIAIYIHYKKSIVVLDIRPSETIRSIACTTVNNFFLTLLIIRRLQLDSFLRIILSCCSLSFPSFTPLNK